MPTAVNPLIVNVQEYMGTGQPEQQLQAQDGSVVNTGTINVYLTSIPGDYGIIARCYTLVPGGSMPWPDATACYAFTEEGAGIGEVYVSPVQSANFPQVQTVNVTVNNTRDYSGDKLTKEGLGIAPDYQLLNVTGDGVIILDCKLFTAGGGSISDGTIIVLESAEYYFCALTEDTSVDQFNDSAGVPLQPGDQLTVDVLSGSYTDGVAASVHYIQF